ncbi:MAG: Small-conductance mechanosensitive channel [Pseudomonadota bacterium]|jgi:small conductance mechanosensitive channel
MPIELSISDASAGLYAWVAAIIPNLAAAVLLVVAGLWFSRWASRSVAQLIDANPRIDPTLKGVLSNIVSYAIFVVVLIATLSQLGIQTTSILAALGAAGLAIGLALQGTLSNIAAGIMLLWLRPFRVGDYIDTTNAAGTVEEVGLFASTLRTADGIHSFVPNSELWNKQILNYSRNPTRRLQLRIGIGYDDDIAKARDVFRNLIHADERVLPDPAPQILVEQLGDSAVVIELRLWTNTASYWDLLFDLRERAKLDLDAAGISIPYPQQDLHVRTMPSSTPRPGPEEPDRNATTH